MAPHADNVSVASDESVPANSNQPQNKPKGKPRGNAKGKKKTAPQNKERVQRLDQLYSKKKRENYFVPTPRSKNNAPEKLGQTSHVVLKVRRIINDKGFPSHTEIDIKSEILRSTLADIFEGIEGIDLNEYQPQITPQLLYHSRSGLQARVKEEEAKTTPNSDVVQELGVALQYIEEDFATTIGTLESLSKNGEITFELLWTLFPPRTAVYSKHNLLREDQVLKLQQGEYGSRCGCPFFGLDLRVISHDGEKLGWAAKNIDIFCFEGAKKIETLLAFPLANHAEADTIKANLTKRGKRYLELLEPTYQEYTGVAITENTDVIVNGEYKQIVIHATGRIMTDSPSTLQHNSNTDLLKPSIEENELKADLVPESDLVYCNPCIGGFTFRQKKWCLFAVSRMSPVIWNTDAFSKLVMDQQKRDLIHVLVRSHKNDVNSFDDIVSGKGKGLVGLLSGNPGVGKTLTAEVISEVTKRPLYMLSAGELGTDVDDVEKNLDTILEVTRQWGCVLLIDEADVFLQERDGLDLQRNALVSIFLRRLEYFQGVLIMTTNRKRTIDAAFDSRIHFKLHYPDLSVSSRVAVWKNCLNTASSSVSRAGINDEHITELAGLNLNGRQIKNAVACAVSIAHEQKSPLTIESIRVILDMVVDMDSEEKIAAK